jgi:hypothetical protein
MTMTMRKKPSTSLQQARERAASELGLPLSDWRVERLAKLVIADEAMQSLLVVAPERVDFGKMLDIDRALADLRKELGVTKPMELKVSFVDGVVGMFKCQHCHKENRVEDYRAPPETNSQNVVATEKAVPAPAPGTVDLVVGAGKVSTGRTSNVVAVPRRDPGFIHNAVALVPDGNGGVVETRPPLKRLQGPDRRRIEHGKELRERARMTAGEAPPKKYRGLMW